MKRSFFISVFALLAASAANAEPMQINLCTGAEGGRYHQSGIAIAELAKTNPVFRINVVTDTGGTKGNMDRMFAESTPENIASGKFCHAMMGQPDGPTWLAATNPTKAKKLRQIGQANKEYLHVLCNKQSGVDALEDLTNDPKGNGYSVAIGPDGSGAWLIWENFQREDASYEAIPVSGEDGVLALSSVDAGDTTCMIIPSGLGNPTVLEADAYYGSTVMLVGAQDKDFNDATNIKGQPLYIWDDIPGDTYETSLQASWGDEVDTISWNAGVYVNTDHVSGKALAELIKVVKRAEPAMQAQ